MTRNKSNIVSLWPQILDALRQVTPWLDLTFHEFLVLENICSQSVRKMVLVGNWEPESMTQSTGSSVKTITNAIRKLKKRKVIIPTSDNKSYAVNCYGLVLFYLTLCRGNRPIRKAKLKQLEDLVQHLAEYWQLMGLSPAAIEMSVPDMTLRPERNRPLYRGSRKLRSGYLRTSEKLLIIAACTEVALRRLPRFSELAVFMRILDLTLGRGKFREDLATLSHIQYGQEGFGTIGLPFSRRRVELAMKSLKDRRFIRIDKKNKTTPLLAIHLNAPGLTALNAKETGTWESKSTFWSTHALYEEAYLSQMLRIDGENFLDLMTELTLSRDALVKELHFALGSGEAEISMSGKWSMGRCPLAEWTHEGGTDDHPSFGVLMDPSGGIYYHCFTCSEGKTLPIRHLLSEMEKRTGERLIDATAIVRIAQFCSDDRVNGVIQIPIESVSGTIPKVDPLPEAYVGKFPLLHEADPSMDVKAFKCLNYLRGRGISSLSCERLQVRYVPWTAEPILIFPYTDVQGRVFVLAARNTERKKGFFVWNDKVDTKAENIEFPKLSNSFAWFGLHKIDPSCPVMLVEGECDALKLVTFGYFNVMASGSAALTLTQMEAVKSCNHVILGFDSDSAGRQSAEKVAAFLFNQNKNPPVIEKARWNLAKLRDGRLCKDPADLEDLESLALVIENLESWI